MQPSEPTLFVVDDDETMLDALSIMAETVSLKVETFLSAQEFLDGYDPEHRGCLVLDVRMPGMNGLELQETLNRRGIELPVIIISGHAEVPLAVRAVKAGAVDFLEKPFKQQQLLALIELAFREDALRRKRRSESRMFEQRFATLTPREREVMVLLVSGNAGKQIAAQLGIAYKTMEKFRAKVMRKMQADSVAKLVLMAVSLGLISPGNDPPTSSEVP